MDGTSTAEQGKNSEVRFSLIAHGVSCGQEWKTKKGKCTRRTEKGKIGGEECSLALEVSSPFLLLALLLAKKLK